VAVGDGDETGLEFFVLGEEGRQRVFVCGCGRLELGDEGVGGPEGGGRLLLRGRRGLVRNGVLSLDWGW